MAELGLGEVHVGPIPMGEQASLPPHASEDGSPNSGQTTSEDQGYTPEAIAALGIAVFNVWLSRAYGMPLDPAETEALNKTSVPVIRKYFAGPVSPEWALAGTVAVIMLPRYLSSKMGAAPQEGTTDDRSSVGGQGVGQEPHSPKPGSGTPPALADLLGGSA